MNDIKLPEPFAWIAALDVASLAQDGWCIVHAASSDPCSDHDATAALYTADQMSAVIAAAREVERERCVEAVKRCLYLDFEGRTLPCGPVTEANTEILRCVGAIRGAAHSGETT